MTETSVTFPPGRYGRRREHRPIPRWLVAAALAVIVLVGTLTAAVLQQRYGPGRAFDAEVLRFYDVTDEQVVIEFSVVVPADQSAICAVRARAFDGAEVGREEVRVPATAAGDRPVVTHRLSTTGWPVTGEVQRCWRDPHPSPDQP